MKTPMSSDTKLTKDDECESVDSTKYRGMIGTTHLGLWYPKGTSIEIVVYVDSDHAGDYVDRKSISDICTFVGCCLTSWFSKKQTALAISTTEAEYVSAGKTRKDRGTRRGLHSTSSSSAFDQPSSSHLNDDDDRNDEGTSRASTPSPIRFVNSLTNDIRDEHRGGLRSIEKGLSILWRNMKNDEDVTTTPSPTTTSSSSTPSNAPSNTPSTNQTSSS
ncbi:hypothetical protein Tco_0597714 [Tanacetum coccineum]